MSYLENFNYSIVGQKNKPKLVFLHGSMGFARNWRSIAKKLELDFEVLTFDQRGHGDSFQPKAGYSPEDFSADLEKIIDELQWEKINLVGHSMGGRNAINFTHRLPQRVIKLVVEDIAPVTNPEELNAIKDLIKSVPTPFPTRQAAKKFLLQDFGKIEYGNLFYSNMKELPSGKMVWRCYVDGIIQSTDEARKKNRWYEIEELKVPTLIIRGSNSTFLSSENYNGMLNANELITGVEIADSGHWVHFEQQNAFLKALKSFLIS